MQDNGNQFEAVQAALRALVERSAPAAEVEESEQRRSRPFRVAEVAKALDVHVSTIYRDIEAGNLRAMRVGIGRGTLRIPVEAFAEYKARLESGAATKSADEVA